MVKFLDLHIVNIATEKLTFFLYKNLAYSTKENHFVLENVHLKATFNADGQLIELIDKKSNR